MSRRQKDRHLSHWYWHSMLGVFNLRLILTPLAIIHQNYFIESGGYQFRYRDVFVFGIRIARFQRG